MTCQNPTCLRVIDLTEDGQPPEMHHVRDPIDYGRGAHSEDRKHGDVRHRPISQLLDEVDVPVFLAELEKTVPAHGNRQRGQEMLCHRALHAMLQPQYVGTVIKAHTGRPSKSTHSVDDDCPRTASHSSAKGRNHYFWERYRSTGANLLAWRDQASEKH